MTIGSPALHTLGVQTQSWRDARLCLRPVRICLSASVAEEPLTAAPEPLFAERIPANKGAMQASRATCAAARAVGLSGNRANVFVGQVGTVNCDRTIDEPDHNIGGRRLYDPAALSGGPSQSASYRGPC